MLNTG